MVCTSNVPDLAIDRPRRSNHGSTATISPSCSSPTFTMVQCCPLSLFQFAQGQDLKRPILRQKIWRLERNADLLMRDFHGILPMTSHLFEKCVGISDILIWTNDSKVNGNMALGTGQGKLFGTTTTNECIYIYNYIYIYTGWWFEPLWKILVNWDDYSQNMGK